MGNAGYCYCMKKSILIEHEKMKTIEMPIQTEEIDKDNSITIYVKFVVNFNKMINIKENSEIILEARKENLWFSGEESIVDTKSIINNSTAIFDKIEFLYNFQERTLIKIHLHPFDSKMSQLGIGKQSFEFKLNLSKLIQERDFLNIPLLNSEYFNQRILLCG